MMVPPDSEFRATAQWEDKKSGEIGKRKAGRMFERCFLIKGGGTKRSQAGRLFNQDGTVTARREVRPPNDEAISL